MNKPKPSEAHRDGKARTTASLQRRVRNARPTAADPRMPHFTLPASVPLPSNQFAMSRRDWIRFVERHLAAVDRAEGIDRIKLDGARGELMRARRKLYHSLGVPCPPWRPNGRPEASRNGGVQ